MQPLLAAGLLLRSAIAMAEPVTLQARRVHQGRRHRCQHFGQVEVPEGIGPGLHFGGLEPAFCSITRCELQRQHPGWSGAGAP